MNHQSTYCGSAALCLLFFLVSVGAEEDCSNPASSLKDALADDRDLPVSLIQMKAVATRNNQTNRTSGSVAMALPMVPGSHFAEATSGVSVETLRAFYLVVAILVLVLIANSSMLYAQFKRQESRKTQSAPTFTLPVDHLVATSKLNLRPDAKKNQLSFYTRAKGGNNGFICPSRASAAKKASSEVPATGAPPTSEQISDEKLHGTGEALDAKLLLPLRETWYAVALEQVLNADGSFDILRITGCPSLNAKVRHNSGHGGTLELSVCSGGAVNHLLARASSSMPKELAKPQGGGSDEFEAFAMTDAAGRCLGTLRSISHKSFELIRDNKAVVSLAVDDEGQLQVSSAGGNRLACVSCLAGHLGICVNAGADTGLIIVLVLAAVLLGGAGAYVLPRVGDASNAEESKQLDNSKSEASTPDA